VKDPKDEQDQDVVNFRLETELIVPISLHVVASLPTSQRSSDSIVLFFFLVLFLVAVALVVAVLLFFLVAIVVQPGLLLSQPGSFSVCHSIAAWFLLPQHCYIGFFATTLLHWFLLPQHRGMVCFAMALQHFSF